MRRVSALLLAACLLLAGCAASPEKNYPSEVVATLQAGVLAVTEASASGDPAAAMDRLDELQATLLDANAKGTVTEARFTSISAAITLVRADLERVISAQVETSVPKENGNSGKPEKPGKDD